ncbi:MAG TPA: hypothetical protein VH934_10775 [Xanthobacteraceae bacterium]
MLRAAIIVLVALGAVALDPPALYAQFLPDEAVTPRRAPPPRARTRIIVRPAYPYRTYSTTFPVPYRAEYPGPGAVRQCTSWLATEHRLSGTVITPQMRCWWQPGG